MQDLLKQFAAQLATAGVQHVFGVTGSGPTFTLIRELESQGVAYHPVAHEAAGAIMAGGAYQAAGHLSASLSIKGPGLGNMIGGMLFNHFENLPVLSLAEAYATDAAASRMHKRMDQASFIAGLTKGSLALGNASQGLAGILAHARAEIPGPVHIELAPTAAHNVTQPMAPAPAAEVGLVAAIARISAASNPVVIAGSLARRREWGAQLARLQVPVFTTVAAKGILDEASPFAAGVFTTEGRDLAPEAWLLPQADLVIGLGLRNLEVINAKTLPAALVLIDEVGPETGRGFGAEIHLAFARPDAFAAALAALTGKNWGGPELAAGVARMRNELLGGGWLPARCFEILESLPGNAALVLDTGSFATIGEHMWRAGGKRRYAGSSNGRFMGGGIPTAIGYSMAAPGAPVFCAMGDGGVRMYPAEIRLAVRRRLPVCFIFMRDGRYGSIACSVKESDVRAEAVTFDAPSWVRAVEGMGCPAREVNRPEDFALAVGAWDRKGPLFVECAFDPDIYLRMTRRLR